MSAQPRPRPRTTEGQTIHTDLPCGACYVSVNSDDLGFCEVFLTVGKSECKTLINALGRLISLYAKCGIDPDMIAKAIAMPRCEVIGNGPNCTKAIADAIREVLG